MKQTDDGDAVLLISAFRYLGLIVSPWMVAEALEVGIDEGTRTLLEVAERDARLFGRAERSSAPRLRLCRSSPAGAPRFEDRPTGARLRTRLALDPGRIDPSVLWCARLARRRCRRLRSRAAWLQQMYESICERWPHRVPSLRRAVALRP